MVKVVKEPESGVSVEVESKDYGATLATLNTAVLM